MNKNKYIATGVGFAMLWGSAGVANKIGLKAGASPLWMTNTRFCIAASILLFFVHLVGRARMPIRSEMIPLAIYGSLVNSVYMSLFIYGLKESAAGISTLALVLNPLIINVLTAFWQKKEVARQVWQGLALGITGVAIATYPLLMDAHVTMRGMTLLAMSMLCNSVATVYYAQSNLNLPKWTINAWQIFFGAAAMLPITFFVGNFEPARDVTTYWAVVFWLSVVVTIVAFQLWLSLMAHNVSKASLWLFLCPLFGFMYAHFLLGEPITGFTFAGTALVLLGLYTGNKAGFSKR
jgi:probable blue pigment (indigoidine) exporter